MQPDNVVTISDVVRLSTHKQQLLDIVATSFDNYVDDNGYEPDGIVYVLGGSRQDLRSGWLSTGDSEQWNRQFIASAHVQLMHDLTTED